MPNASSKLADAFTGRGIDLLRFDANERARVLGYLQQLSEEITRILQRIDPTGVNQTRYRAQRLKKLQAEIKTTIKSAYGTIDKDTRRGLSGLARIEGNFVQSSINSAVGFGLIDSALTAEAVRAIVGSALIQGAPSSEWWSRQAEALQKAFADQIRMGYGAGESVGEMVRRIRGRATGKRHMYIDPRTGKKRWYVGFKGGIMDTGTRQAQALVRTSVQTVAAEARRRMYKDNDDVVKGIQQISSLDGRTTNICKAYSGASWDLDFNPINGTALAYGTGVPRHWNCRSTEIPVLKSYRELGLDIDEMPPSTRASMDGQIAEDITFDQWLSWKDEDFQNKTLGHGKAALWRSGKITLTDLVDGTGRELTLKELETLTTKAVDPAIIKKYTGGWSSSWNSDLWRRRKTRFQADIDNLSKSLDALPAFEGVTYRGVPLEDAARREAFIDQITRAGGYQHLGFMSTSFDKKQAVTVFAQGREKVLLELHGRSGRNISGLGKYDNEQEILFDHGSRWVLSGTKKERGLITLILEELLP